MSTKISVITPPLGNYLSEVKSCLQAALRRYYEQNRYDKMLGYGQPLSHFQKLYLSDTKGAGKREIPMNSVVYRTLLSVRKSPNSPYVFCHKNDKPYRDVRVSLDKAARQARIEAVEVLGKRMDTYMDTTGRKKERAKNRHPRILATR